MRFSAGFASTFIALAIATDLSTFGIGNRVWAQSFQTEAQSVRSPLRRIKRYKLDKILPDCSNVPESVRAFAVRNNICGSDIILKTPPVLESVVPDTRGGSLGTCGTISTSILPSDTPGMAKNTFDVQSTQGDITAVFTWKNHVKNFTTDQSFSVSGPTPNATNTGPRFSDFVDVPTKAGLVGVFNYITIISIDPGFFCLGLGVYDIANIR
jgi:hypothetical protein